MANKPSISSQASPKYGTVRELLAASLARRPLLPRTKDSRDEDIVVYAFADRAFSNYLIRGTRKALEELAVTTSLTPAPYIFHGPEIATPLLEGRDAEGRPNPDSGITIMAKQPGRTLEEIEKEGPDTLALALAEHPEAIERLFRVIAFAGLHEQTQSYRYLDDSYGLDLNFANILRAEDGTLSLIDQMSPEDIKGAESNGRQNYSKAHSSVGNMQDRLLTVIKNGREAGCDPALIASLEDNVNAIAQATSVALDKAKDIKSEKEAWKFLKSEFSDPHTEEWRGLEDSPTNSPAFKKVNSFSAAALDLDRAKPQDLLDQLNALHGASVARAR